MRFSQLILAAFAGITFASFVDAEAQSLDEQQALGVTARPRMRRVSASDNPCGARDRRAPTPFLRQSEWDWQSARPCRDQATGGAARPTPAQ